MSMFALDAALAHCGNQVGHLGDMDMASAGAHGKRHVADNPYLLEVGKVWEAR